jgi:hypothetical protein
MHIPLFLPLTIQRFAEHHPEFRQKSWNKLIEILKFRKKFQIFLDFSPQQLANWSDKVLSHDLGTYLIRIVFSVVYSVFRIVL